MRSVRRVRRPTVQPSIQHLLRRRKTLPRLPESEHMDETMTTVLGEIEEPCTGRLKRKKGGFTWLIDCALRPTHTGRHETVAGQKFGRHKYPTIEGD